MILIILKNKTWALLKHGQKRDRLGLKLRPNFEENSYWDQKTPLLFDNVW